MSILNKCFWVYGYAWNWVSHCDDNATISHKNENHSSLRASCTVSERSHVRVASKTRHGNKVWDRYDESSSFPLPLMALLLAHAFVCHLKWRGCSQSITFLGNFLHEYFHDIYIIIINPQNNISPVLENNIKYNISSLIFFNHSFHCFLFLQILRNIRTSAYIWICCKQAIKRKHYWSWSTSQETSLVCCSQNKWKLL